MHVEGAEELTFAINTVREVFQSENVNAETSPVDVGQAQSQEHLTGTEVNDMPYANSHSLRNSLPLMPGVVQEATGALHVNGSSENQVLYLLNGFNITNPISGQFQTLLAVEGIRSVDLSSGRYFAGVRKGVGGRAGHQTPKMAPTRFITRPLIFFPGLASSKVCTSETGIRAWASPAPSFADGPGSPTPSIRNITKRGDRASQRAKHPQRLGRQQPAAHSGESDSVQYSVRRFPGERR